MKRQLIVCCDGTWNVPDNDKPTNVGRIAELARLDRHLNPEPAAPERLIYYVRGVGGRYKLDSLAGGATGSGLHVNVKDAYLFIAENFREGDEIFLFGFSRGATTVRRLAGMINTAGLLSPDALGKLREAYDCYQRGERLPEELRLKPDPTIKFLGVFDTVGALGVPLKLFDRSTRFKDCHLPKNVWCARQALALHEPRSVFQATVWDGAPEPDDGGEHQRVKQVWFAGVHSDVGGGYKYKRPQDEGGADDQGLANLCAETLKWMLDEAAEQGLVISEKAKRTVFDRPSLMESGVLESQGQAPGSGERPPYEIHDSMNVAYWLLNKIDWLTKLIAKGDPRMHRRYVKTSEAIGQSVHKSVWEMYFAEPSRFDGIQRELAESGMISGRRVVIRRALKLGRKRRFRFAFHRNKELKVLARDVETASTVGEDAASLLDGLLKTHDGTKHEPARLLSWTSAVATAIAKPLTCVGRRLLRSVRWMVRRMFRLIPIAAIVAGAFHLFTGGHVSIALIAVALVALIVAYCAYGFYVIKVRLYV